MERGKLSIFRESAEGPFYKIQSWEKQKNVTRYVPRNQVEAVKEAIAGYERFETLSTQYADQIVQRTRAEIQSGVKKKTLDSMSPSRKARKSSR